MSKLQSTTWNGSLLVYRVLWMNRMRTLWNLLGKTLLQPILDRDRKDYHPELTKSILNVRIFLMHKSDTVVRCLGGTGRLTVHLWSLGRQNSSHRERNYLTVRRFKILLAQLWVEDWYEFKYAIYRLYLSAALKLLMFSSGRIGEYFELSARKGSGRGMYRRVSQ